MSRYLSIDTEATGLEEDTHLIQIALVPLDGVTAKVETALARETLVRCPSFEDLKPRLNPWVLEHNEGLIRAAHAHGIAPDSLKSWVTAYMEMPEIKDYFKGGRPALFGKSLSALDIPLLRRYLGRDFMERYFHHHTLDITCVARFLVDAGQLPEGCESTSKLINYLQVREDAQHTALSDAVDMAHIYFKLLERMRPLPNH